jgi:hypothetical protein
MDPRSERSPTGERAADVRSPGAPSEGSDPHTEAVLRAFESAIEGSPAALAARSAQPNLTHTGPRLIANDALRKVHSPWMLAVSDRAGFAERQSGDLSDKNLLLRKIS